MLEPFTFISNYFSDQFAEVPVTIMDPLSWVGPWFDQDERFFQEVIVFLQRTEVFLEKDLLLQLTAEDYFVATDET